MNVRSSHFFAFVAVTVATFVGCATPIALRKQTVQQASTLSEIHQQQVLDNLAKFVQNPDALPDFAWPKEGTLAVKDGCEGRTELMWDFTRFAGALFGGAARRDKENGWALEPINDSNKLQLMRCVYQKAVANCGNHGPSISCPNCEVLTEAFYDPEHESDSNDDVASYGCIQPGCCTWFAYGPKDAVPKCPCCKMVGHYCGTYVWVLPGGENEFSKLTLTILDFATHDFPPPRTMKVTLYRKEYVENGKSALKPSTSNDATQMVEVEIPIRKDATQVLPFTPDPKIQAANEWLQLTPEQRSRIAGQYRLPGLGPEPEISEADVVEEIGKVLPATPAFEERNLYSLSPEQMQVIQKDSQLLDQVEILENARSEFVRQNSQQIEKATPSNYLPRPRTPVTSGMGILQLQQQLDILTPAGR